MSLRSKFENQKTLILYEKMLFIITVFVQAVELYANSVQVDLTKCKVTHVGSEYIGRISITESNNTCQYWSLIQEKGAEELVDVLFPDGSKNLAKNYCRNPNMAANGPWCFTTNKRVIKDTCGIPLCRVKECRLTGPGMEYIGNISKTASGRKCQKWKKTHKLEEKKKEVAFRNNLFPDGSITEAGKMCRNPNGNVSGPWCYVDMEDSKLQQVEFCDIPFCDDVDPVTYSDGSTRGRYFFFSNINDTNSIKLDFRLWNEEDWLRGEIYVLLSVIDTYTNRSDIKRWDSAVEIMFSNAGSRIASSEDSEIEETPNILSAIKWTSVEITWASIEEVMLVRVFESGKIRPFLLAEIDLTEKLLSEASFQYISIAGSPSLWNITSKEEECFIHTSPLMEFNRHYLMKKTTLGLDVDISVRAVEQAVILFRVAPMLEDHQVQLVFGDGDKNKIAYFVAGNYIVIDETESPVKLSLWKWENFKISILKDRLQIYWDKSTGVELLLDITHHSLARVMWISFGSPLVSYWAIYCDPRGVADPPAPRPPECLSNENDDYNGTQSVTRAGHQCIPWVDSVAIPEKYQKPEYFERYGGKASCQNFCRNLDNDPRGPFCFVRDEKTNGFIKEQCYIRSCHVGECKLAGTANDYTGHLNRTRSKRSCKFWTDITDDSLVNLENFPDPTLEDAANYCRSPDKSPGGAWCFTTDPEVPKDFCYVKDCDKPLECTIISAGLRRGHNLYILPRWRKSGLNFWLKTWNPDIYEGLRIRLTSLDMKQSYELSIGDDGNEKLKFSYVNADEGRGEEQLLVHKTLPHLVPAGKWGGYWLRPDLGVVQLGYHGVDYPFFEWNSDQDSLSFDPAFLDFGTIQGHWIGVNFLETECILERTTSYMLNRLYPINIWKVDPMESKLVPKNLILHLRGMGYVAIVLMSSPDFYEYMLVKLSSAEEKISIWEFKWNENNRKLVEYDSSNSFSADRWTEYELNFKEKQISMKQDRTLLFTWESRQHLLLFYWFSIQVFEGYVVWTANCPPADIDGPPRNGHWGAWGPWSCSVSCGGGQGRVFRTCDSPPPNVFGRECTGSAVYEGPCNTFPCGEISPGTSDIIRWHLSSQYTSLEVEHGTKVVLPCNNEARSLILNEVKKINITWTFNGFPYSRRRSRINNDFALVIPKASDPDNGVYMCIAYQDPYAVPSKIILEVITLIVNTTTPTKRIKKGRSLSLKCNGVALSYVYGDLSQKWEVNGLIWRDYGITTLETTHIDKVLNLSDSHAGIWTCIVVQQDLGFKWKTNWMYIEVTSAPNFWSYLMEDSATSPLFGKLGSEKNVKIVFFVINTTIIGIVVIFTILILRHLHRKKN